MVDFDARIFISKTAQSSSIDFNNGTITTATLTVTTTGGGLLDLFMLADGGSNFEAVTSGVAHTFSNTGTDLRWKAVGSGVTVTKLTITNYH